MNPPSHPSSPPHHGAGKDAGDSVRVVLLYKRYAPTDEHLLKRLESELPKNGFKVWADHNLTVGVEWASEVERQARAAHAVVALLSASAMQSEMLCFEIEHAHETAQLQGGRPRLIPVRIKFNGPFPDTLAGILDPLEPIAWSGPDDDIRVVNEIVAALKSLKPPTPRAPFIPAKGLRLTPRSTAPSSLAPAEFTSIPGSAPALESVGGAVPLNSPYYVSRSADAELNTALSRSDSIILIKGGRQIGKTSMLARGLQFARERGAKVVLSDFQKFNASNLENVSTFYLSLAESLADQLDLSVLPSDVWDDRRGPNVNFERYVRREVLGKFNAPLVWGLDEVDRLFVCSYGSEVFGLFRSWHNERALDPSGPWAGLSLVIAYATEAHLFITDMNQSPFNVGTRLVLEDFTREQLNDLNRRYGSPLKTSDDTDRFHLLLDGHPFLVRRGLHELATNGGNMETFEGKAAEDDYVFGDHLRRILVSLAKDTVLTAVVRGLLQGQDCPTPESFYRLRTAGVITGNSPTEVRLRCELYTTYLSQHLL